MYFQITTRCNMSCAHCCYSCTAEGEDMPVAVFDAALEFANECDGHIFIGGGEPTLHPNFWGFMLDAIVHNPQESEEMPIGIITNGSMKKHALKLAELSRQKVIHASLSQDEYHDPIDDAVVEAFEKLGTQNNRGIHDTSWQYGSYAEPMPHGRAVELLGLEDDPEALELARAESVCPCDDLMIRPNGDIYQCGCEDAPRVGTVFDGSVDAVGCHRQKSEW